MNRPKLTYVGPSLRRRDGLFYDPRVGRFCGPFPSADATAVRLSVQRGTAQAWGLTDVDGEGRSTGRVARADRSATRSTCWRPTRARARQ